MTTIVAGVNKTPFEIMYGQKPHLSKIHAIGTPCYVLNVLPGKHKLASKALPGVLVGFQDRMTGYRVYLPEERRVVRSSDVTFIKSSPIRETRRLTTAEDHEPKPGHSNQVLGRDDEDDDDDDDNIRSAPRQSVRSHPENEVILSNSTELPHRAAPQFRQAAPAHRGEGGNNQPEQQLGPSEHEEPPLRPKPLGVRSPHQPLPSAPAAEEEETTYMTPNDEERKKLQHKGGGNEIRPEESTATGERSGQSSKRRLLTIRPLSGPSQLSQQNTGLISRRIRKM